MMEGELHPALVGEMRSFMNLCEGYNELIFEEMVLLTSPQAREVVSEEKMLTESILVSKTIHPIMGDLASVVEDLRAFMESTGGDYALGVEDGMQRAAEMIETLLKRHKEQ